MDSNVFLYFFFANLKSTRTSSTTRTITSTIQVTSLKDI